MRPRLLLALAAVVLVCLPAVARADAIVVTKAMTASTIAEIFIAEGSIRVELEPRKLQGEPGFVAHALWNVAGSVGHWGHIHTRTNQYEAELTIQPIDGSWKVTGLEILQEERL